MKLFYLYIIFLPLMNIPKPQFMGTKIQYVDLIFIPIFALFINELFKGKFRLISERLDFSFLILAVVSFVSLLHSPFKNIAVWDTAGLFYLVSLYFVFTRFINSQDSFRMIISLLFVTAIFVSIAGIVIFLLANVFKVGMPHNFIYGKSIGEQSAIVPFARPASLLSLPEMFINFSLLGLAAGFIYRSYCVGSKKARKLADFSLAIIILSVFLSFSRSLVGVMFFLTAASFYFLRNNFTGRVLKILSLAVFLILLCSTLLIWVVVIYPLDFTIDRVTGIANLSFNTNWDTRVYLAKAASAIAKVHPFLGLGLGSYAGNFIRFLSQSDISKLLAIRPQDASNLRIDPHSLYFGALAEMGFLGVIAVLFIFRGLFSKMKSAFRFPAGSKITKDSCFILLAAFAGFLLNGFFVDILSMRSFWVLMALGSAAANLANQQAGRV